MSFQINSIGIVLTTRRLRRSSHYSRTFEVSQDFVQSRLRRHTEQDRQSESDLEDPYGAVTSAGPSHKSSATVEKGPEPSSRWPPSRASAIQYFGSGPGMEVFCRDNHTVCFRLDANTVGGLRSADQARRSRFLIMLSANRSHQAHSKRQWHEVELQPELAEDTVPVSIQEASMSVSAGKRKVQFASTSTVCVETVHKAPILPGPISDLCSTLGNVKAMSPPAPQDSLVYILNQSSTARYNMRLLRCIEQDIDLYSLQDILCGPNSPGNGVQASAELSRRDRLYLAAVLACGVLQLHGS
ncbi:hypothetical protein BDV11DRAFT_90113 [Aspergillus similis]